MTLGQQAKADTLRLLVEGMEEQGEDGVAWAWSIGTATCSPWSMLTTGPATIDTAAVEADKPGPGQWSMLVTRGPRRRLTIGSARSRVRGLVEVRGVKLTIVLVTGAAG